MIRIIFLLSPVFISLFWAITLAGDKKNHSIPRTFLSQFMLFPFFCFGVHFLYFAPLPQLYPYFDVPLQLIGNLIFPVFYIYFRLLTVDKQFSLRLHAIYLILPSIIPLLSAIAVVFTPWLEFKTWVFDNSAFIDSPSIRALIVLRRLVNIQFLIVVVATFIASYMLLSKYGANAEKYYSDINDGKYNNAKILSLTIVLSCVASFIALAVGRYYIMPKDLMIYPLWLIFSIALYLIGYMGMKQKPVNPTFEIEEPILPINDSTAAQNDQQIILKKILELFDNEKIYMNSQLTIMDVVTILGTNRTYISAVINRQYGQNFCSFVNGYRIQELERIIRENPKCSYEILAERCGFGSTNTLKRAVYSKTSLSVSEWRNQILK